MRRTTPWHSQCVSYFIRSAAVQEFIASRSTNARHNPWPIYAKITLNRRNIVMGKFNFIHGSLFPTFFYHFSKEFAARLWNNTNFEYKRTSEAVPCLPYSSTLMLIPLLWIFRQVSSHELWKFGLKNDASPWLFRRAVRNYLSPGRPHIWFRHIQDFGANVILVSLYCRYNLYLKVTWAIFYNWQQLALLQCQSIVLLLWYGTCLWIAVCLDL